LLDSKLAKAKVIKAERDAKEKARDAKGGEPTKKEVAPKEPKAPDSKDLAKQLKLARK
jgi:hypothetical protein